MLTITYNILLNHINNGQIETKRTGRQHFPIIDEWIVSSWTKPSIASLLPKQTLFNSMVWRNRKTISSHLKDILNISTVLTVFLLCIVRRPHREQYTVQSVFGRNFMTGCQNSDDRTVGWLILLCATNRNLMKLLFVSRQQYSEVTVLSLQGDELKDELHCPLVPFHLPEWQHYELEESCDLRSGETVSRWINEPNEGKLISNNANNSLTALSLWGCEGLLILLCFT